MLDRLGYLISYVGSAAVVAFVAACLTSPRIDTFVCDTGSPDGADQCRLLETLAAMTPEANEMAP